MSRSHTGFALFMLLLLIAPQIPIRIPGGIEKSCVSLGLAGLIIWFFANPKKMFFPPRIGAWHPLFWILIFTAYVFVVSLLSGSMVSIAYSLQYLLYVVLGTILMKQYGSNFANMNCKRARSILFAIGIVFSIGIVVSLFTGPIYPHQVRATQRHWEGLTIQQGVGFSESQNIAGPVVIFFLAACTYMYHRKIWKKWILLTLLLSGLLATLSRGAIFSFGLALAFVFCLDSVDLFVQRAGIKVSLLKNVGFLAFTAACLVIPTIVVIYWTNKPLLRALLSGFGLSQGYSVVSSDASLRFGHWAWGLNTWASGNLLKMLFGGGFRSSMVAADYGAWKDAHNMYITILGDFGIVGLTLFLGALFGAFFRYARLFLTDKAGRAERFGLMALLALSIDNMTGPYFYSPICLSLLIFVFAVTL